MFVKARGRRRRIMFKGIFDRCTIFLEYSGRTQMKALGESFPKHPLKAIKSYLTHELLAIEKNIHNLRKV